MTRKHPKPHSKRGRRVARAPGRRRVRVMKRILRGDPWGARRN